MKYKFLRYKNNKIKSDNGDCTWQIGKWQPKIEKLEMCESGYHCSNTILDALGYVSGEVLAIVETGGKHKSQSDKDCWQKMRIKKAYRWTKKDSVALAIFSAELVLKNYEDIFPNDDRPRKAIEAAKKVLEHDTTKNRLAAWSAESAARSAAWSAAGSAARSAESAARSAESAAWSAESAAGSAARSAAGSAARSAESAAWSAARSAESAAWSAALNKINKWLKNHIKELEQIKE